MKRIFIVLFYALIILGVSVAMLRCGLKRLDATIFRLVEAVESRI